MGATPQNDPATRELTELMDEYCRVLSMGEAPFHREEAEHLYKRDDDFTAFDLAPPNTGYHGWAAYAEAWYKIMNKYAHFEMTLYDDLRVFHRGDVAWTSASFNVKGRSVAGDSFDKDGRVSLVWVREDGRWLITHEHVSSPRVTATDK
ncbi:MAG TPA: nuclear transport factor 2 family protein [Stellaceae bacterium]|nr:nuclear transport factor 2 family protein [Stellaceae bacterium]